MKRGIIAALLLGASVVSVPLQQEAASAHTPTGGADCTQGAWAQGASYESQDTNTLTVTVDGSTVTEDFDTDGYLNLPIPADGTEHSWSWTVSTSNANPDYSASDSGTITCGEPPVADKPARIAIRKIDGCGRRDEVWVHWSKNVKSTNVDEDRRARRTKWVVRATADDDALFANGKRHVRVVKWTTLHKHCNSGS